MLQKIDPFIATCLFMIVCSFAFFTFLIKTENENKNKRVELIKEAIEKNWTPEQIRVLLESR